MILRSRLFGDLEVDPSDGFYVHRTTTVRGVARERGLYVSDVVLRDEASSAGAIARLDEADELDERARSAIAAALADAGDETVGPFVDFHLEELGADALRAIVGADVPPDRASFLASLALLGFAIHAAGGGYVIVADYGVGRDVSDQVLAVAFDPGGVVRRISHES